MDTDRFFLASDAYLQEVVDGLQPGDLDLPAPSGWTSEGGSPTLRDILFRHAYDEAWIPDVLAGKAAKDGDPFAEADLLGDDPIASYDARHEAATEAVTESYDADAVLHFTYGDYPASEGLAHMALYRAAQAWNIARLVGRPARVPDDVLDGLDQHVMPNVAMWREFGVFPPPVDAPEGADREARMFAEMGFWPGPDPAAR